MTFPIYNSTHFYMNVINQGLRKFLYVNYTSMFSCFSLYYWLTPHFDGIIVASECNEFCIVIIISNVVLMR